MWASDMDEITRRRLDVMEDNKEAKPKEVLELILDDINKGNINPDGLYIICVNRSQPRISRDIFRAGLTWEEQIAYLQLEIADINKWKLEGR